MDFGFFDFRPENFALFPNVFLSTHGVIKDFFGVKAAVGWGAGWFYPASFLPASKSVSGDAKILCCIADCKPLRVAG